MIIVELMNVKHEDVICMIFPYTFQDKASTWYFYLSQASVTSWNTFETSFIEKFGKDNTSKILVLYISRTKMEAK
jgi:hypothetical protein